MVALQPSFFLILHTLYKIQLFPTSYIVKHIMIIQLETSILTKNNGPSFYDLTGRMKALLL